VLVKDTDVARDEERVRNREPVLQVGGPRRSEAHLRFDVYPLQQRIRSARLRVFALSGTAQGPRLYTTSSWGVDGFTWAERPQADLLVGGAQRVRPHGWVEFDVSHVIGQGERPYHFALVPEGSDGLSFVSTEGANRGPYAPEQQPWLEVVLDSSPGCVE